MAGLREEWKNDLFRDMETSFGRSGTIIPDYCGVIIRYDYFGLPGPYGRVFCFDPEEVSENITPNYDNINIMGRSAPIFSYKGTSEREIVVTITLFARTKETLYKDVKGFCDWLKCFVYPVYANGNMFPPSRIFLSLGKFINILGILNAYHPRYKGPYEMKDVNGELTYYPMICEIPLEIKEVVSVSIDAREVQDRFLENERTDKEPNNYDFKIKKSSGGIV